MRLPGSIQQALIFGKFDVRSQDKALTISYTHKKPVIEQANSSANLQNDLLSFLKKEKRFNFEGKYDEDKNALEITTRFTDDKEELIECLQEYQIIDRLNKLQAGRENQKSKQALN